MLDFSPLLSALDESGLMTSLIAVGGIMIFPRVVSMGVDWIKAGVGAGPVASSSFEDDDDDFDGHAWEESMRNDHEFMSDYESFQADSPGYSISIADFAAWRDGFIDEDDLFMSDDDRYDRDRRQ